MKMSIKALALAAVAAAAVALTGCTSIPGVIQDKTKPLDQNGYTVVAPEVSATEMQAYIFGYGLSDLRGSTSRRLYKSALHEAPGADALIEYTMDRKSLNLVFVNIIWYTMTGTAVQTK
jgi:hypothetical protein